MRNYAIASEDSSMRLRQMPAKTVRRTNVGNFKSRVSADRNRDFYPWFWLVIPTSVRGGINAEDEVVLDLL
jgi:hypothetical protein